MSTLIYAFVQNMVTSPADKTSRHHWSVVTGSYNITSSAEKLRRKKWTVLQAFNSPEHLWMRPTVVTQRASHLEDSANLCSFHWTPPYDLSLQLPVYVISIRHIPINSRINSALRHEAIKEPPKISWFCIMFTWVLTSVQPNCPRLHLLPTPSAWIIQEDPWLWEAIPCKIIQCLSVQIWVYSGTQLWASAFRCCRTWDETYLQQPEEFR